jgi:hypothetical protein
MTILEREIRSIPAAGSGKANQVPRQSRHGSGQVVYAYTVTSRSGVGSSYTLPSLEAEENEGDPAEVLATLSAAADALEAPDYPDSPERAQELSDVSRALYQLQADSIAAREDREQ